eukprot:4387995-Pyramimonas_sp.AAC.1
MAPPPHFANPSHGSWPHRELHRRPSGRVRMAPPPHFGTPLTRFVAPIVSPTESPSGRLRMAPPPHSAHHSHGSWPHRKPHRRPQWQSPHDVTAPFRHRHTPYTVRGPIGSSAEGPSGR